MVVPIRPKRFPHGVTKKLQTPSAKPFKILKWVGPIPNAYVIDRPLDMGISPIFNVEDLIPFQRPAVFLDHPYDINLDSFKPNNIVSGQTNNPWASSTQFPQLKPPPPTTPHLEKGKWWKISWTNRWYQPDMGVQKVPC